MKQNKNILVALCYLGLMCASLILNANEEWDKLLSRVKANMNVEKEFTKHENNPVFINYYSRRHNASILKIMVDAHNMTLIKRLLDCKVDLHLNNKFSILHHLCSKANIPVEILQAILYADTCSYEVLTLEYKKYTPLRLINAKINPIAYTMLQSRTAEMHPKFIEKHSHRYLSFKRQLANEFIHEPYVYNPKSAGHHAAENDTLLMQAIKQGKQNLAITLIKDSTVNINAINADGMAAFHLIYAEQNYTLLFELLVRHYNYQDVDLLLQDEKGRSINALQEATQSQDFGQHSSPGSRFFHQTILYFE